MLAWNATDKRVRALLQCAWPLAPAATSMHFLARRTEAPRGWTLHSLGRAFRLVLETTSRANGSQRPPNPDGVRGPLSDAARPHRGSTKDDPQRPHVYLHNTRPPASEATSRDGVSQHFFGDRLSLPGTFGPCGLLISHLITFSITCTRFHSPTERLALFFGHKIWILHLSQHR